MASKIILFLSAINEKNPPQNSQYVGPDGTVVIGDQTNVAPVRWLLHHDSSIREIICVVTATARRSAWDHFRNAILEDYPAVQFSPIPYEETDVFSDTALPRILDLIEEGNQIWLEITGGFRNANMYLLLISRVLSYCGFPTKGAVYSNNSVDPHRIEDITGIINLFDLVNGMQELTSLGNVRTLQKYYGDHVQDARMGNLIASMKNLSESIALCRTEQISESMQQFNTALDAAKDHTNPLMRNMLRAFRSTFGKEMNVPAHIEWCIRNDMLQQALTVYTEKIPGYLFQEGGLLSASPQVLQDIMEEKKEHEDPYAALFMKKFLMLSCGRWESLPKQQRSAPEASGSGANDVQALANSLRTYLSKNSVWIVSNYTIDPPNELKIGVENVRLILKLAYLPDGRFNESWAEKLPKKKKAVLEPLKSVINSKHPSNVKRMLNTIISFSTENLCILMEIKPVSNPNKGSKKKSSQKNTKYHIRTIENLAYLFPNSDFEVHCSYEQMAVISRDYIYIKTLRNLTNHASDDTNPQQEDLVQYFEDHKYKRPGDVAFSDVIDALKAGLQHIADAQML